MARNGRLIVIANEEDDEMVDIVNGKYPIVQVSARTAGGVAASSAGVCSVCWAELWLAFCGPWTSMHT